MFQGLAKELDEMLIGWSEDSETLFGFFWTLEDFPLWSQTFVSSSWIHESIVTYFLETCSSFFYLMQREFPFLSAVPFPSSVIVKEDRTAIEFKMKSKLKGSNLRSLLQSVFNSDFRCLQPESVCTDWASKFLDRLLFDHCFRRIEICFLLPLTIRLEFK